MEFNEFIFPAPKPTYKSTLEGLYRISKKPHRHPSQIKNEYKNQHGAVSVQVEQQSINTP